MHHSMKPEPSPCRSPVYDIRELSGGEDEASSMVGSLEREKGVLVDDLRWQGQSSHPPFHIFTSRGITELLQ